LGDILLIYVAISNPTLSSLSEVTREHVSKMQSAMRVEDFYFFQVKYSIIFKNNIERVVFIDLGIDLVTKEILILLKFLGKQLSKIFLNMFKKFLLDQELIQRVKPIMKFQIMYQGTKNKQNARLTYFYF
jgi:hypothetical protein